MATLQDSLESNWNQLWTESAGIIQIRATSVTQHIGH